MKLIRIAAIGTFTLNNVQSSIHDSAWVHENHWVLTKGSLRDKYLFLKGINTRSWFHCIHSLMYRIFRVPLECYWMLLGAFSWYQWNTCKVTEIWTRIWFVYELCGHLCAVVSTVIHIKTFGCIWYFSNEQNIFT